MILATVSQVSSARDYEAIVPVKDSRGNVTDWHPVMLFTDFNTRNALATARRIFGTEADVRFRGGSDPR